MGDVGKVRIEKASIDWGNLGFLDFPFSVYGKYCLKWLEFFAINVRPRRGQITIMTGHSTVQPKSQSV
jgi:hypothetical protein